MSEKDFLPGDIVEVIVEHAFCGLPIGVHRGVIVDIKELGKSIAFADTALAIRARSLGVSQFLPVDCWDNCEVVRIIKGAEHM